MRRVLPLAVACAAAWAGASDLRAGHGPERYDVTWDSPGAGPADTMPLGNGDIGVNAWTDARGDVILYISKTDAWEDNARLAKIGCVRFSLDPSPMRPGLPFRQTLRLEQGDLLVGIGGGDGAPPAARWRIWVDANRPVICVEADVAQPCAAYADLELWRTNAETLASIECSDVMLDRSKPDQQHAPTVAEPDTVLTGPAGRIGWYHHNRKSVGPEMLAKIQDLPYRADADPLLNRVFGAVVTAGAAAERAGDTRLRSSAAKSHRFELHVLTRHPSSPADWTAAIEAQVAATQREPPERRREQHEAWWTAFWERSWIHVDGPSAKPAPPVPANGLPFLTGQDQQGGSRFRGAIARVSVAKRAMTEREIAALAAGGRDAPAAGEGVVVSVGNPAPGAVAGLEGFDWTGPFTAEAWVRAEAGDRGGRILDKITVGGGDGFLIDSHPGESLRVIVGNETTTRKDALKADAWHHVALVSDPTAGAATAFLDGRQVARRRQAAGSDAFVVSRGYALQRFVNACAGRGRYPIKFNGSIFTVPHPGSPGDADYRRWGPGYWWQNTRLPYIGMCASGDFDLMEPLFRMYGREVLPVCVERTRRYFGWDGAAYFPECIYFWGAVFSETYGWQPAAERTDKLQASGWHKWEWVGGLELVGLMLDAHEHTGDAALLRDPLLPTARAVLSFFDRFYPDGPDGRMVMHPSQALETWWECTNPMPELAGLHAVTERLLALPADAVPAADRAAWERLRRRLPDLPVGERDGVKMLLPAAQYARKSNCENPELYAVFPFRRIALDKPGVELGREALKHRWDRGHSGWRQDDVFMAYLGLTEEAQSNVTARARSSDANSRFPAFWGPNYDWVPDQDHGGILIKAVQSMLMQTDGRKILLLPAWPRDWTADFRLHAPYRTTVEGRVRDGRVEDLRVTPPERRADVVLWPATSP